MLTWPIKDTAERLDYAIDWSNRLLAGETINTSAFTVAGGGVTIVSQTRSDTVSLVWLEGGTAGQTAKVVCQILTSADRVFKEVIAIPIVNRAA